jgi:drug/metabolite transporter (DMT)-like permease
VNGIPVVTAVAAWVVLDEKLTFIQAVGGVTVLVGVTFANARIVGKGRPGSVSH